MYVYANIYIYVYMCVRLCVYVYKFVFIYIYIYMYIYMYIYLYIYTYIFVYVSIYDRQLRQQNLWLPRSKGWFRLNERRQWGNHQKNSFTSNNCLQIGSEIWSRWSRMTGPQAASEPTPICRSVGTWLVLESKYMGWVSPYPCYGCN